MDFNVLLWTKIFKTMKKVYMSMVKRVGALVAILALATSTAFSAEVVYKIVEYNKTTGEFTLSASGQIPKDAWAYFQNDYGATTGNRYNQIPRNNKACLFLEGWKGCKLKSVTLSMCSNNKSGQVGLSIEDGDNQLYLLRPADFSSSEWFGQWVSKDLNVYVDITKELDIPELTTDEGCIKLSGGTSEGSVYVDAIAIEYDEPTGMELESPLGWTYSRLEAKSPIKDGDEVMIYRNGCAAADIDGMETSHYLDVVAIPSTTDVTEKEVLRFTLHKADAANYWTMTDQYGRLLGATAKQALAWNEGNTQWAITLGYDGATITNGNENYGTLRYNEPTENYARFNVYTSKTLPLPFLYLKGNQKSPVYSSSLSLDETEKTVSLEDGYFVIKATMLPTSTTDKRIVWSSDNAQVATVNGGYVSLLGEGQTTITARAHDGGCEAKMKLTVTNTSSINSLTKSDKKQEVRKVMDGSKMKIVTPYYIYNAVGSNVK